MTTQTRSAALSAIRETGVIPVIRAESSDIAVAVVEALADAGLGIAEITMTVPGAIEAIGAVEKSFGDKMLVGAGTVTDEDAARRAIDAGAKFIVSPCLVSGVIEAARREDVAVLCGALTPSEIFQAFRDGADMVKVFPAQSMGGAAYLRALRGPFPEIPLVPTGGVTLDNLRELFDAGAAAVGVGSDLISKEALAKRDYESIGRLARKFLVATRKARGE